MPARLVFEAAAISWAWPIRPKPVTFKNVSFSVRKGEIVALTGLIGAGRTEVMQAIYGVLHPDSGCIKLNGKKIVCRNPQDALKQGIGLLPEDRHLQGLVL